MFFFFLAKSFLDLQVQSLLQQMVIHCVHSHDSNACTFLLQQSRFQTMSDSIIAKNISWEDGLFLLCTSLHLHGCTGSMSLEYVSEMQYGLAEAVTEVL